MFFWLILILSIACLVAHFAMKAAGDKYDRKADAIRDEFYRNEESYAGYQMKLANHSKKHWFGELCYKQDLDECAGGFAIGFGVFFAILVIALTIIYGSAAGEAARYQQKYEALSYQYENAVFEKDSDIVGNKQLYDDILEYNEDVIVGKTYTHNFWWGIFWPNFYDDLPIIEYQDSTTS